MTEFVSVLSVLDISMSLIDKCFFESEEIIERLFLHDFDTFFRNECTMYDYM